MFYFNNTENDCLDRFLPYLLLNFQTEYQSIRSWPLSDCTLRSSVYIVYRHCYETTLIEQLDVSIIKGRDKEYEVIIPRQPCQ